MNIPIHVATETYNDIEGNLNIFLEKKSLFSCTDGKNENSLIDLLFSCHC